ncbi:histidine phosphatase family protein [Elioraea rosea]|uniref:histidine phosphatase family protein n=1 Tax=Elioraea rosea TaxID=2492390 RepID=UPI0011830AFD|nr:histidine phosphatase family protein [Elioraea rosea]
MFRRRLVLAALAAPVAARAETSLIDALRRGGHTVYMRHAITDRSQADTGRLGDRAGQRNLSEAGRAQAEALGRALRSLGVPVGEVLASPVFRAADTAALAFGANRYRIEPFLTADDYTHDGALLAANIARTRQRLAEAPRSGNDILVGHIVPLAMVLGRSVAQSQFPEGALAVFRPGPAATLLGILPAEEVIAAAG